jgi:hypothetical protein
MRRSGLLVLVVVTLSSNAAQPAPMQEQNAAHDFDFLYGQWCVHNRRLKQRLANSHDWIEFEAQDSFHAIPGGLGSEENYRTNYWTDFAAIGLHLYEPAAQQWTLYWGDNRNMPGTIQPLATGRFINGVGVFYAPDSFAGKPITVRVTWKQTEPDTARWEQAFSTDKGKSWETNWTMDFERCPENQ